jgi:hypothetical protein
VACAAVLCGARGYLAMAEWGRNHGPAQAHRLSISGTRSDRSDRPLADVGPRATRCHTAHIFYTIAVATVVAATPDRSCPLPMHQLSSTSIVCVSPHRVRRCARGSAGAGVEPQLQCREQVGQEP